MPRWKSIRTFWRKLTRNWALSIHPLVRVEPAPPAPRARPVANAMTDPRTAYREASARGVSPVQSVVQLYEQIIEDLRQALQAIEQNQVELRTHKINHAILVIGHLQSRLNFQSGGKVAQNLNRFYDVLRRELLQAQFQGSAEILSGRIND